MKRLEDYPDVLYLDDVAAVLRCSRSTIQRRLRDRIFPVAPIPGLDRRRRWSRDAIARWLAAEGGRTAATLRLRRRA